MSVQPRPWPEPAPEIVSAIRAKYARRRAPLAVQIRDQLGELFPDVEFEPAFGVRGRPGWSPGRLALVTVLQMAEDLTDRQAADAVRERLSWQYALGLGLEDPGFDHSVLSEFRSRVVEHGLEERVLDLLLETLKSKGLVGAGGKQRSDSTHVVSAVRDLNRLELAGESVRACLEALALAAPDWLGATFALGEWGGRYRARVDSWRLPTSQTKRNDLAAAYARDGYALLTACYAPSAPTWLRELPAVQVLRVVLIQNYYRHTNTRGREVITRRESDNQGLPPGRTRISSPYDTDTRWAAKGDDLFWNGYKVHISETCDIPEPPATPGGDPPRAEPPNVITNVSTTDATVPDTAMTTPIHAALDRRGLLPGEHFLDSGYPTGGPGRGLSAAVRDHAGQPAAGRPLSAGQGRRRLRPGQFHHRLRTPAGHLSARRDQRVVEPGRPTRHRHCRDQLLESHLRALPRAGAVHHLEGAAPPAHRAATRGTSSPTERPHRPEHQDLAGPLRDPSRRRRHHPPRCRRLRHAPRPLPRTTQDPPRTRLLRHRAQPRPT